MKHVILSADGDRMVYALPDIVADHLRDFCIEFCDHWMWTSPNARKYHAGGGACSNDSDCFDYLPQIQLLGPPDIKRPQFVGTGGAAACQESGGRHFLDRDAPPCAHPTGTLVARAVSLPRRTPPGALAP